MKNLFSTSAVANSSVGVHPELPLIKAKRSIVMYLRCRQSAPWKKKRWVCRRGKNCGEEEIMALLASRRENIFGEDELQN